MLKWWCACLQAAITCEHGRCIFWNFPQSHHLSSNLTTNFPTGHTSLGLTISSTLNLVVFLSNSRMWCMFDLESASCKKLVAYLKYTWSALTIAVICVLFLWSMCCTWCTWPILWMKLANFLSSSGQNLLLQPNSLLRDPTFFLDHMQDTTAPLEFGLPKLLLLGCLL